ncbi:hypothetical protein BKA66DRAFT_243421 [Pyrenochaeta sp. MPI-SDFR-AT-0127]|nr:hypothetical protein BKA66DRAFT_243421 [Pyrenochaeta sp. MPI-SDFR-AT-0127]
MTRRYRNWRRAGDSGRKTRPRNESWEEKLHLADDQIAPSGASGSTAHLQRWAFMTANLPQQGHRKNEMDIVERIQRRYHSPKSAQQDAPKPHELYRAPAEKYMFYEHEKEAPGSQKFAHGNPRKRDRSGSLSPSRSTSHTGLSAVGYLRLMKRRRSKSPSRTRPSQFASTELEHPIIETSARNIEKDYD